MKGEGKRGWERGWPGVRVCYSFEAMMMMIPSEERAQLPVSLRETRLRPAGLAERPPLFPFCPRGGRP